MKVNLRKLQKVLLLLLLAISNTAYSQSIKAKRDSLFRIIEKTPEDTTKANIYNDIAMLYVYNQPKVSIDYAFKALSISKENNYYEGITNAYGRIFNGHLLHGSHSDSLLLYIQSLEKYVETQTDKKAMNIVFWNYGIYYGRLNQIDKEIEAYINGLEHIRKIGGDNNQDEASLLSNIGVAMVKNGNHLEATEYFKEALSLSNYNTSKANILSNLGRIYDIHLNKTDSAKIFYEEAYQIYKALKSNSGIANILITKAKFDDNEALYDEANKLYLEALEIIETNEIGYELINVYSALSEHYLLQKKFQLSIKFGEKALEIIKQQDDYLGINKIYDILDEAYIGVGNYKKAYEIRGSIIEHRDSISSISLKNKVEELETRFFVGQKETENELLKAQQKIDQTRIRNQNIISITLFVSLLLAAGWGISIFKNQQQKQKYNQELEDKNEELQQIDEAKTRFFANISHEYKTPLTLILNPIRKVLSRNQLNEEDTFLIKTAEKSSLQLYDLTNQVLELTKFDVNRVNYNPINFNLFKAVKKTYADFKSVAVSRQINFLLQFNGDENLVLFLDYFKFSTILKNLISNALKFTPNDGKILINVTTNKQEIIINVTDNGRGIHNDDLPHIFDRYYQAKNTATIQEGGTGIGLAICNEFAKVMNGNVSVQSEYGKESQFTVRIPIVINNEASSALFKFSEHKKEVVTTINQTPNDQLPNILLVEDNLDMQDYIRFTLQNHYNISAVPNGKIALNFLEEQQKNIHLIISDLMMPEMNGYEFISYLKQTPKYATIPTIMLTALNTKDEKLKALRIGIDDYLTKPFVDEELMARINNLIHHAEERKSYRTITIDENKSETSTKKTINNTDETPNNLSIHDLEWLEDLENLVKKHCGNSNLKIDFIATEMSVSQTGIFRKTKQLTGLTPKKYIDEIRFQMARELLETQQNYTIKAVAMNVGFKDEKNFSRNFKKRFGKYPSEYLE